MEVGVVFAPDIDYEKELGDFLGHKPDNYKWHVDCCLNQPLDLLETRFYTGKLSGRVITNIMTTEYNGIGILGHVFTLPEQRRKGACKGLMGYQMQDFQDREGQMLYLGTGYDSAPYWIYHYFGFQSVYPEAGFMTYSTVPEFETRHFARGNASATKVKPVQWHDWGALTALTGIVGGDYLRSSIYGLKGPTNFEGGFLYLKQNLEADPQYHQSRLLQSETGAIVAFFDFANRRGAEWTTRPILSSRLLGSGPQTDRRSESSERKNCQSNRIHSQGANWYTKTTGVSPTIGRDNTRRATNREFSISGITIGYSTRPRTRVIASCLFSFELWYFVSYVG